MTLERLVNYLRLLQKLIWLSNQQNRSKMTLNELKSSILEDGIVDATEVSQMRAVLFADGVIDRQEADFLFEINDAVSGKANDKAWAEFFVEAIASHLLDDDDSPGEIDADELKWLSSKLLADGQIDGTETALLRELSKNTSLPEELASLI